MPVLLLDGFQFSVSRSRLLPFRSNLQNLNPKIMSLLHRLTHKIPKSPNSRFFATNPTAQHHNPSLEKQPSTAYYDSLVNAAGRSRDFPILRHLLNRRVRDGCFNTTKTFKFVSGYDADHSTVLHELCETLARLDKGFSRKSAYDSLIARLCKLNRIDESLRVVDTMVRGDYGVSACTFHPILCSLTKKKKMEEAWGVLKLMGDVGIHPDITAYNYLLTAYCFSGDLPAATGMLRKIVEEGMEADSRTYDALVLGACRTGKVEAAMVVLRRMEDVGVPLLYSTHAHVISGMMELGYYAQAVEFVRSYGGRDKGLDTESYGCLARRLIEKKRFEEAQELLAEMRRRGLAIGEKLRDFYHTKSSV